MRKLIILALLLLPCWSLSYEFLPPQQPKLIVFIIHGFMGGSHTFCDLGKVLEKELGNGLVVKFLNYPTKGFRDASRDSANHRDNVDIPAFTRKAFEDIADFYDRNMYDPNTPYAIIAHSQGGLITTRLLLDCHQKGEDYCVRNLKKRKSLNDLPKNLSHFFSIMTPFWGSSTATYIKDKSLYSMFFPKEQLRNLSIGSDITTYNREILIESDQNYYQAMKRPEVVNISGNASRGWLSSILQRLSDLPQNRTLESDFVVPIPSANMDFLYFDYSSEVPRVGKTQNVDYFYSLNGNHVDIPMADVGLACVNEANYLSTPTFPIIRRHLAPILGIDEDLQDHHTFANEDVFSPDVESFIFELQLDLPEAYPGVFYFDDTYIEVMSKNSMFTKIYTLKRKNDLMNNHSGFNQEHLSTKSYVTYYTTGAFLKEYSYIINRDFKSNLHSTEEDLIVRVKTPWFKPLETIVRVSPSYTTYARIKLEPLWDEVIPRVDLNLNQSQSLSLMQIKSGWTELRYDNRKKDFMWTQHTTLPADLENQARNVCYVAELPKGAGLWFSYHLKYNHSQPFNKLAVQGKFNVFGRVTKGKKGDDGFYPFDRVFVTDYHMPGYVGGYFPSQLKNENLLGGMWMDTKHVRILRSCK